MKLFLFIFLFPLIASADDSCWSAFPVVDSQENWDFQTAESTKILLPSFNSSGPFLTKAAAQLQHDQHKLHINFDYDSDQLSLPYNVYRIEVTIGAGEDSFTYTNDFTYQCAYSGISIFPRGNYILPSVSIPPHSNGNPRTNEPVKIKIWGHL